MIRYRAIPALASLLLTLQALTLPEALQAQGAGFGLAAVGCRARQTVIFLRAQEQASGWCTGAVVSLKLGPLVFEGSGFRAGRMEAVSGPPVTRDAGEMRAIGAIAPVPWVALEGGYLLRAFSSALGYQRWQVPSGGIKLAAPLGDRALMAHLRGHYLAPSAQRIPAGQPTATVRWNLGLSVESGLTIAPRKVPLFFGAFYRFERYDFPGEGAGRLEQFELLTLFGGIRFGS